MRDHLRMKLFNLIMFLLLCPEKIVSVTLPPTGMPMAKPGCNSTCPGGYTEIPYPFGIGLDCALSEPYSITCNGSGPLIRIDGHYYQVDAVSLGNKTVSISTPFRPNQLDSSGNKTQITSINLTATPFFFSKDHNKLSLMGCGNALLYQNGTAGSRVLSGCTSTYKANYTNDDSKASGCFGINCCEANIPYHLEQYWIITTVTEEPYPTTNSTSFDTYPTQSYPTTNSTSICARSSLTTATFTVDDLQGICSDSEPLFPVVLAWTLQTPNVTDAILGCQKITSILELESGNVIDYGCECKALGHLTRFYSINPYLNGSCNYDKYGRSKAAIIGACAGSGLIFLVIAVCTLYKLVKEWRNKKLKRKFFERNGGLLLQQQLSAHAGAIERTKIFSIEELNKASDGFNANRILGQGGQGTVYKGMLTDGNIVAIKKSKKIDENQLQEFINEFFILSQINHRNVVKLLGCCLETEVPLLVYEFLPNGTLYNLLHNGNSEEFPLTWNMRLRIAREIADAVAYLHSATSTLIFHKDIKSSNILLGEKYIAKVADFGTSRSVAIDQTHLTTCVQGTSGYIDPEYYQSSQFTDKSDVYSYGVVLAELLTRQKPAPESVGESNLAARFLTTIRQKGSFKTILDPVIVNVGYEEEVAAVAKLASRCLNSRGERRPTMKQVAWELESLTSSTLDSTTQANSRVPSNILEEYYSESGRFSGTAQTWTFGNVDISSAQDDASH